MRAKSILISGAGIAGPTLAYWLLHHGFQPTLVEVAPKLRTGGYVVDFWGLGYDVAERMGVLPDLRRAGYDVQELRIVDNSGRRVSGFDADVFRRLTDGRYLSIARSDLAAVLFSKVAPRCETLFGDSIKAMREQGDDVTVEFQHSSARRFDLVVGADGLHSQVRHLRFGPERQFEKYLGYMVAAFQADGYRPRDELAYVSHSLPGKQIARFALHGDRTMFLFVFAAATPPPVAVHDIDAQKAVLAREFHDAGWEAPQILRAMETSDDLYFDRVSQIRMDSWSKGRIALVGDAAFCVSLLAGQGSALAMTAAYVLAGELGRDSSADPLAALRRYETLLRPFIVDKQHAAQQFAGAFAPKTHFGLWFRNQLTKAFALPLVARLTMGSALLDRLELPDYDKSG